MDNGSNGNGNGNGASEDKRYRKMPIRPQLLESGKKTNMMIRNGTLSMSAQVVASGGETNLHAHAGSDAIWLVLNGQATFYGEGDKVIATLNKYDSFFIEHGAPYWFESSSPENLVILRFGAKVEGVQEERLDYGERQFVVAHGAGDVDKQREAGLVSREVKFVEGKYFGD
jgi:mannose-6-phosphate isomerase-like protein (cupin superfamily)